jgi:hypothetical protein
MSMVGNHSPAIFLILAMTASPVLADTYKWIDAKGVVTYSDSPPPAMATKAKVIEERVSVIPPDPALGQAVAAMQARAERRAQYEEADYALRQRYMLEAQTNYAAAGDAYADSAYYPYGYGGWGYGVGRRFGPRVAHYGGPIRPYNSLPPYSSLPSFTSPPAGARPAASRR